MNLYELILSRMNLKNFEQHIERKIIDRGFDYYENDSIEQVDQVGELEFSANVWGTDEYSVFIKLNRDLEVVEHDCDCPYDWGVYCKHEVALLYYIRDGELYKYAASADTDTMNIIKRDLNKMNKAEIIELILERAKRSKQFRTDMLWELGHETED